MQTVHKPIARSSTTNRSAVTNGSKLLVGIDGRSPTARRFRDLVQAYSAEIGGKLTEFEKAMVKQAASLAIAAEAMQAQIINGMPVNSDDLIRTSSEVRRILAELAGKAGKRKPAGPTLSQYLAEHEAEQP